MLRKVLYSCSNFFLYQRYIFLYEMVKMDMYNKNEDWYNL